MDRNQRKAKNKKVLSNHIISDLVEFFPINEEKGQGMINSNHSPSNW